MSELLIGCGSSREKRIGMAASQQEDPGWQDLTTLDINPAHHPDIVWDLRKRPWPFEDSTFDEVHAYEVLEHLGRQGDYAEFFADFTEIWRVLKPDGVLCVTCPSPGSPWVWGDPSHTRALVPESLVFLSQKEYELQVGKTAMSDFRYIYHADFEPVWVEVANGSFMFIIRAIKATGGNWSSQEYARAYVEEDDDEVLRKSSEADAEVPS